MTEFEAQNYLDNRAYDQGISFGELMEMTPSSVSDCPIESAIFWQQRDYSHKLPVSTHPELEFDPDNAMPENPSVNRSEGATPMTFERELQAHLDNEVLAMSIDSTTHHDMPSLELGPFSPFLLF